MRTTYLLITLLFILVGCGNNQPQISKPISKPIAKPISKTITKSKLKTTPDIIFHDISEFIYKKNQIVFFEKQFDKILKLKNKDSLQKYANFYRKNASYFINGKLKAKALEKRRINLDNLDNSNSHKVLLTKALSLGSKDSIAIYERLAKEGNIFAKRELAEIYKYDNKLKSVFWYKNLIENNDIESIKYFAFANLHMVNPIIVQDTKKAVKLYEKLDSLGEVSGLVHLGNIYEYGYFKNDFPVDKKKSLKYFQKAAKKGYTPAQKKLTKIYLCEKCKGDRYNKEEGMRLLNILVSKGDEKSKKILESLNSSKNIEEKTPEIQTTKEAQEVIETQASQEIEEVEIPAEEIIQEEQIQLEKKEVPEE